MVGNIGRSVGGGFVVNEKTKGMEHSKFSYAATNKARQWTRICFTRGSTKAVSMAPVCTNPTVSLSQSQTEMVLLPTRTNRHIRSQ